MAEVLSKLESGTLMQVATGLFAVLVTLQVTVLVVVLRSDRRAEVLRRHGESSETVLHGRLVELLTWCTQAFHDHYLGAPQLELSPDQRQARFEKAIRDYVGEIELASRLKRLFASEEALRRIPRCEQASRCYAWWACALTVVALVGALVALVWPAVSRCVAVAVVCGAAALFLPHLCFARALQRRVRLADAALEAERGRDSRE